MHFLQCFRLLTVFLVLTSMLIVGLVAFPDHVLVKASGLTSPLPSPQTDWQMSGFGPQGTRFNPSERTINTTNVSHLVSDWTALTSNIIGSSSPVIANGVAYIGSYDGEVYAIDVTTGQRKWVGVTHTASLTPHQQLRTGSSTLPRMTLICMHLMR